MTKQYQLMLLLKANSESVKEDKRDALIKKLLGNAEVVSVTDMGKRPLAFVIKKQKEAHYFLISVKGDAIKASDVSTRAKLLEDVVRLMLIVKE